MALAAWISRIGAARLTETCAAMLSCEISAKGSGIARPAIFYEDVEPAEPFHDISHEGFGRSRF